MVFNHILVPFDGSKSSEAALDKAIQLAESFPGTRLSVAHVLDLQPVYLGDVTLSPPDGYQKQANEETTELLDQAERRIGAIPNAETVVLAGNVATAILEYAEENTCDLIVMGTRSLSALKEFVLGSVSHSVLQHAKAPVLIVK